MLSMSVWPPCSQCTMWWAWAPVRRGPTADAAFVSRGEHGPLVRCGVALAPAQPQRLTLLVEDGREDVGVTRQPEEFLGSQRGAVTEVGVRELPGEGVIVGDEEQVDALRSTLALALPGDEHLQRVRQALLGGGAPLGILAVPQPVRCGGDRRLDAAAGDGVKPAEQLEHAVGLLLEAKSALCALALAEASDRYPYPGRLVRHSQRMFGFLRALIDKVHISWGYIAPGTAVGDQTSSTSEREASAA